MDVRSALSQIIETVTRGEIVFPTSAELALKVQRAVDDPDSSIDQLAKLVQADPLLAARVVAIANSVAYNRSGRTIADVKMAVSRLGFKTLRSLATSIVVRQMEGMAKTPAERQMAAQLWTHTAHVAALAHMIARRVTHIDPESAFFAGIVHEVGSFFLISRAGNHPGLLDGEPGSLEGWDGGEEGVLGRAVLQRLGVPDTILIGIEGFWEGYLAMPPKSLADTLLLADELAPVESPLSRLSGKGRAGMDARIELAMDAETLSSILSESATEVASLTAALQS